ncbi:MAG: SurA N-terminal domain-containing protein [Bacteroidales bacterium]|nr:SurA N-terminal domain-containing protein [Bacteroidales bacterium]
MAVLEKIRVKFGLAISIIIALALLSFIIDPTTLESALHSMSSKYDVGQIAGKAVPYTDFLEDVERYTQINEIITGSSVQDENTQKQIRDAAWQELVDKYMFIKNAKAAGITVGKAELVDLTTGTNLSPVMAGNPAFMDESGNFSAERVRDFVAQIPSDESGRLQLYWNYLQNSVNTQQYYAKYGSIFTASTYQNALEKKLVIDQNNATANVDYVYVNYPFEKDSTITVSKSEIKKFYKDHESFYEQAASRDIEYVVFEVVPSAEDISATNDEFAEAYAKFADADNMKTFLLKNSDRQLNNYWYKAGELNSINKEVNDFVFGGKGSVSPIISEGETFYAVRVMDSKPIADSAYVKHILLQGTNANKTADSLVTVLRKGASFSGLAAEFSVDQNSAADGELGNIGWMTQTYMIPGFEGVITAAVNQPMVIKTQYGTHVVVVSKKTAPIVKKQVAILEKTAVASKATTNEIYSRANKFATISNKTAAGYAAAVDTMKVYSHKMNISEATSNYGAIENAKEVTRWAFDNKVGKASNIITVNNKYFFIACLNGIHKEGVKPIEEVSFQIENLLYTQKLAEAKKAELAAQMEGCNSIQELAEKIGASVTNEASLSLAPMSGRGNDPALAGAVFCAEQGKLSGPVAGAIGTYAFVVNSKEAGSFYTEDDAAMFGQRKAQYNAQGILPTMSANGVVKDNRARFF